MSHTVVEVEELITDPSHWEIQVMKVQQLRAQIRAHKARREAEAKRLEQEQRARKNGERSNQLLKSALAMAARNRMNERVVL
ncbi:MULTISPECIES: hypothetical protein [Pseudoalteromonas]|uniref:Uncharacterized protein n=1 Tax=Pseudoalteromonas piscicida TaxID=43662 RepID=A0AAD0RKV0_PSEO7|nr:MULTISPECIES: hypothetical protein [Pseudoalteromonas]ASD68510.1 hypothetical protein B1L02_16805 [Pseudoalteromonas piscicida]AXR03565.1 hypothetical protein D0511_16875 [Pseudoalteromonas piscicida]PHI36325.1 hypothetical protein CBQ28_15060 [Pseudoalteromonas sp. GCY]QQQ66915.1 hypothetical protein JJQ94_22135 [Pseudoalteromonas sp. GCY]